MYLHIPGRNGFVDGADVGMLKRRSVLGFTDEAAFGLMVLSYIGF